MKGTSVIAALLALPLAAAAQHPPLAQRHFREPAFDSVELAGTDRVVIVPGAARDVVASGDPRAIAALDFTVHGGRLRIARKPGHHQDRGATITVTMPHIRAALLTGSGDMSVSRFDQDAFEAVLAGSGDMSVSAIRLRHGAFTLAGSGDLDLDAVTATDLDLAARGSGHLGASGTTSSAAIDLVGSGSVDTSRLHADTVTVAQTGSGSVRALAARQATVSANASGGVTIIGHPRCTVAGVTARRVSCG